ncbi:hypothetical protein EYS14_22635 [Alteromonadaceae bacterium M269]|nr:hypothetical protein EYS14_22635 [Alteromonadaceae bacterium M269]
MVLVIAFGVVFLFELYVSTRVVRCVELEKPQKIVHLCLIWLIPIIGAVGILIFIINIEKDDWPKGGKSNGEFGGGPQNSISHVDAFHGSD